MLCVRKDGEVGLLAWLGMVPMWADNPDLSSLLMQVVLIADGQVTQGSTVVKPNVKKTRKIGDHVVGGFAGA